MSGWQIFGVVYLVLGFAFVWIIIPEAESETVRQRRGTLRWYLGGIVAGLVVTIIWLPVVIWGMIEDGDGRA